MHLVYAGSSHGLLLPQLHC